MESSHHRVAIVGSGFAGLGTAIRLKQAGRDDFVILERAADVGGVWRDNVYPGCAVDVESHLYSLSFAPNAGWRRRFAPQAELREHLRGLVDRFGLRPHLRLRCDVHEAAWDDVAKRWVVQTSAGTVTADVLVAATGGLSEPSWPDVPGLRTFSGTLMHSARWDASVDLRGKRVGVIGTGASAVQIVPAIQPLVSRLTVFQRTPSWLLSRGDVAIPAWRRALYARVPLARRLVRSWLYFRHELYVVGFLRPTWMRLARRRSLAHLEQAVADPVLRAKLTPSYEIGCKRILLSDDYWPAFAKGNVDLVTSPIREVTASGVVTDDGVTELDVLVVATGFHVTDPPIAALVRGRDGRTLAEAWGGSMRAFLGVSVAGFPNLFLPMGPNTGLGHSSVLEMLEPGIEHVLGALDVLDHATSVEPRQDAQDAWIADVDRRMRGTVWTTGGCKSWYLDATGRNSTLWPGYIGAYRRRVGRFEPKDYVVTGARGPSRR